MSDARRAYQAGVTAEALLASADALNRAHAAVIGVDSYDCPKAKSIRAALDSVRAARRTPVDWTRPEPADELSDPAIAAFNQGDFDGVRRVLDAEPAEPAEPAERESDDLPWNDDFYRRPPCD